MRLSRTESEERARGAEDRVRADEVDASRVRKVARRRKRNGVEQ